MKKKPTKRRNYKLSSAAIEQRREAGQGNAGVSTPRRRRTARENGQLGGRPGNPAIKRIMQERGVSRQRAWAIWKESQK